APGDDVVVYIVLLHPDLPQDFNGWMRLQFDWSRRSIHPGQQLPSILANLEGQVLPFPFGLGQTGSLKAWAVPVVPYQGHMGCEPVRRHPSQPVQRLPQSLSHTFDAIQGAPGGLHVGRVGALLPTGFEQAARTEAFQQYIQQPLFLAALYQPLAKLTQDGKVKAGILQRQAKRYFQSIRLRTASAACRSDKPSANCKIVTTAS